MESSSKFPLQAYTALELARLYKVHKSTFLRWVEPFKEDIGEKKGRFYTIAQVKIIIEKLGVPGSYYE